MFLTYDQPCVKIVPLLFLFVGLTFIIETGVLIDWLK